MSQIKYISLPFFGLAGLLTSYLLYSLRTAAAVPSFLNQLLPGLIFGTFILIWLFIFQSHKIRLLLVWLAWSIAAYFIAYYLAVIGPMLLVIFSPNSVYITFLSLISIFIGGLVGGYIVISSISKFIPLNSRSQSYIAFISAFAGVVGWVLLSSNSNSDGSAIFLYIFWQTTITLLWAIAFKKAHLANPSTKL